MAVINLKGKYSDLSMLIDDEDYEMLSNYNWTGCSPFRNNNIYAISKKKINGKWKTILAHQLIMGTIGKGKHINIDHINHNGLDNRKKNLRITNSRGNSHNAVNNSKYIGVYKNGFKWFTNFYYKGDKIRIGFPTPEMAMWYYNQLCISVGVEAPNEVEISDLEQQRANVIIRDYIIKKAERDKKKCLL